MRDLDQPREPTDDEPDALVELAEQVNDALTFAVEALRRANAIGKQAGPAGRDGKDGSAGAPGDRGADGVGLAAMALNEAGDIVVNLSDGRTLFLGNVRGPRGEPGIGTPGPRGESIVGPRGETGAKGDAVIGPVGPPGRDGVGIQGERGETGAKGDTVVGPTGPPGRDGVGIQGERGETGAKGDTVIGPAGPPGRDGVDAMSAQEITALVHGAIAAIPIPKDGLAGRDGTDGRDGEPGKDGQSIRGEMGPPGPAARDGRDGESVKGDPGEPGRDGRDGKDADPTIVEGLRAEVNRLRDDVVAHQQAFRTADAPSDEDWSDRVRSLLGDRE